MTPLKWLSMEKNGDLMIELAFIVASFINQTNMPDDVIFDLFKTILEVREAIKE